MQRLSSKFGSRRIGLAGLLAVGLSTAAWAVEPVWSSGLGEARPAVPNVSIAPSWQVYVFTRDGVKYIQINDTAGNVQAVIATSNGQFLVLPMGAAAQRVSTPQQPLAASSVSGPAVPVYNDGVVRITASSQSDGTTRFSTTQARAVQTQECECVHPMALTSP